MTYVQPQNAGSQVVKFLSFGVRRYCVICGNSKLRQIFFVYTFFAPDVFKSYSWEKLQLCVLRMQGDFAGELDCSVKSKYFMVHSFRNRDFSC